MRVATLKAAVKLILWLLLAAVTHARAQEALWPSHFFGAAPDRPGILRSSATSQKPNTTPAWTLAFPLGTSVFPARFNPQRLGAPPSVWKRRLGRRLGGWRV